MDISIIIPFLNAENTLARALDSLQHCYIDNGEIVLVDNNSKDDSLSLCADFKSRNPGLKIIITKEAKPGQAAARNTGARISSGNWLLFTDSDCLPSAAWVQDYLRHFGDKLIGAVAGCIRPHLPTNAVQKTLSLFTLPENPHEIVHDRFKFGEGLYPSANLAVRRDVFGLVGGFNESLMYGEDHDLCYRIYGAGYKIKAVVDASVEHIHRTSIRHLVRQSFGFGTAHPYQLRHFTSGVIVFRSPVVNIEKTWHRKFVWIDLNQADKKALLSLLPGLVWWPLFGLAFAYFFYLCGFVGNAARKKGIGIRATELPYMASLLILKSVCLTCGRASYSLKQRVFCL